MSDIRMSVVALEFCRHLEAVGLFQASARVAPEAASVRAFARHDGLTMVAANLRSMAVTTMSPMDQRGTGIFTIPAPQVKVILAMFKQRLSKETASSEYLLSIEVTPSAIKIAEASDLFDLGELWIPLTDPRTLERGDQSDEERAMSIAARIMRSLRAGKPQTLAGGAGALGTELALAAKAERLLGTTMRMHALDERLLIVLGDAMVIITHLELDAKRGDEAADSRALREYRDRMDELVDAGVI